jgi:UDP-2,3-diacylglucosamine pyrophosphatase LpxH
MVRHALNVKKAVNFVNNFEHFIAQYTKDRKCSGVVCGHIHAPAIKTIEGIDYYNCGDWVESCSALIEHEDGRLELIEGADNEWDPDVSHPAEPELLQEPSLISIAY